MILALRTALMLTGLASILFSTVLYHRVGAAFAAKWWHRFGGEPDGTKNFLVDARIQRIGSVLSGFASIGAALYLSTSGGHAFVERLLD